MKLECWKGFDHSYRAFHSPVVTASPQTNPSLLICSYRNLETSLETSLGPSQPPLNSSHPQVSSFLPLRAITKNHPDQLPTFLCLSQLPSAHSCSSQGFPPLLEPQISAKISCSLWMFLHLLCHLPGEALGEGQEQGEFLQLWNG